MIAEPNPQLFYLSQKSSWAGAISSDVSFTRDYVWLTNCSILGFTDRSSISIAKQICRSRIWTLPALPSNVIPLILNQGLVENDKAIPLVKRAYPNVVQWRWWIEIDLCSKSILEIVLLQHRHNHTALRVLISLVIEPKRYCHLLVHTSNHTCEYFTYRSRIWVSKRLEHFWLGASAKVFSCRSIIIGIYPLSFLPAEVIIINKCCLFKHKFVDLSLRRGSLSSWKGSWVPQIASRIKTSRRWVRVTCKAKVRENKVKHKISLNKWGIICLRLLWWVVKWRKGVSYTN